MIEIRSPKDLVNSSLQVLLHGLVRSQGNLQFLAITKPLFITFSICRRTNAIAGDPSLYYITFTCRQWLPLFEVVNAYELVYNWFNYLKANHSIKTTSYVVMPNHVHCILFFPNGNYDLSKIIANGKRFYRLRNCQAPGAKGM